MLRFPHFLENQLTYGGEVVSLTRKSAVPQNWDIETVMKISATFSGKRNSDVFHAENLLFEIHALKLWFI
jgi:hypothetical protein